eukprot:CAMPEP_0194280406 /NCGR_PEP_ID=MMETSP0169-20130528/17142_1 /TAXON_ID=218684 /ORGANISM="Corethron pennatum, Strain L29A3" /LENGTH=49 /DNA_ID=CAMNT_0039025099 /DNA_START=358 /DNA_END=507 /DNA_ORIENTATION=-
MTWDRTTYALTLGAPPAEISARSLGSPTGALGLAPATMVMAARWQGFAR